MEADTGSPGNETIYRADVVGSMLRPAWLVEARQRFRAGALAPEAYRKIEDRAVAEAVSIQEKTGVDVVTDGEMRPLYTEAADAVRRWVCELFDAGCRYVQIDAPEFNEIYADARVRADFQSRGLDPERFKAEGAELLNFIAGAARPRGAQLGLHVCKGNGTQSWIAEGGYEDICREVFRRADGFDIFHLEFDDERSGSFEPFRHLPDDKVAVLGLVSTKWQALEEAALLKERIQQAAAFHPLERLALAPQCGFASASETAEQRKITPETQAAKLRRVAEVAHSVWN